MQVHAVSSNSRTSDWQIGRSGDRASWYILAINQLDALISQIYFWNKTLHVSDSSSVHHRSFSLYTQQWYMSYRFCWQLASRIRAEHSSILILLASCITYTIAVCTVKTADDGQRNCPKHVEFYSKNKFEKLVHLVGFVIRIQSNNVAYF